VRVCVCVCTTRARIAGNGTVDFNEFIKMMSHARGNRSPVRGTDDHHGTQKQNSSRSTEELEEMREAFRVFDLDGNGLIDANELKLTMSNLGENLSDSEVKQMLKLADRNGDGKIDYEGKTIKACYPVTHTHARTHARMKKNRKVSWSCILTLT